MSILVRQLQVTVSQMSYFTRPTIVVLLRPSVLPALLLQNTWALFCDKMTKIWTVLVACVTLSDVGTIHTDSCMISFFYVDSAFHPSGVGKWSTGLSSWGLVLGGR